MTFVTPVVVLWLEREIAQWMIDPTIHRTMSERTRFAKNAELQKKKENKWNLSNSRLQNVMNYI